MSKRRLIIKEVGPRDGLQNEKTLSVDVRFELLRKLVDAGVKYIEVGSVVNPFKVPQMANTDILIERIKNWPETSQFFCLVFNEIGLQKAVKAGISEVSVLVTPSETFNRLNLNCSTEEALRRVETIGTRAKILNVRVRGYVGMAFGCPYEGAMENDQVLQLSNQLRRFGAYEIVLADTIGQAYPDQIRTTLNCIFRDFDSGHIGLHLHDTFSRALDNTKVALEEGIRIFDSALGGLGGCPFARGAKGNISTEQMLDLAIQEGFETGINREKFTLATKYILCQLQSVNGL